MIGDVSNRPSSSGVTATRRALQGPKPAPGSSSSGGEPAPVAYAALRDRAAERELVTFLLFPIRTEIWRPPRTQTRGSAQCSVKVSDVVLHSDMGCSRRPP